MKTFCKACFVSSLSNPPFANTFRQTIHTEFGLTCHGCVLLTFRLHDQSIGMICVICISMTTDDKTCLFGFSERNIGTTYIRKNSLEFSVTSK